MTTLITVIMVISCFILVGAVLLQPAKGGGSGVLGGSSQSLFGSTGGTTFLFRLTMWCAGIIMVGSLFLSWYRIREGRSSVVDMIPSTPTAPVQSAPVAPVEGAAPATPPEAPKQ